MRLSLGTRGFTMIELIMLIVIGAFVVGGIVAFTRNITENTILLKDRLAALDLAQRQMETELNAYYGWIRAVADSDCRDVPAEFRTYNLRPDITDTPYGSFIVRRNVIETVRLTPNMADFSQPLASSGTYPPYCVGLKEIRVQVDYAGGTFANPLIQLTAYKESRVLDDTD